MHKHLPYKWHLLPEIFLEDLVLLVNSVFCAVGAMLPKFQIITQGFYC
jgi:hypothetical protein